MAVSENVLTNHKLLLWLLLSLLMPGALHAQDWEVQESGTDQDLRDVFFLDSNTGWAVGENSTILHTRDGGDTWIAQICPVDSALLEQIQFVNASTGYIVGRFGENGVILATKDGGSSWILQYNSDDYSFDDLSFINPDTGWVAGNISGLNISRRHGIIMMTYDGGEHWVEQWNTSVFTYWFSTSIPDIEFISKDHGFALLRPPIIDWGPILLFGTINGGQSWDSLSTTISEGLHFQLSVKGDTIWVTGLRPPNYSIDGGLTWNPVVSFPNLFYFPTSTTLVDGHTIGVLGRTSSGSVISFSSDMGSSWKNLIESQIPWIDAIYALDASTLWAVGRSGLIMFYSEREMGIDASTPGQLGQLNLYRNYPNPFNPVTTIRFDLPQAGEASLIVYDIKGRQVEELAGGHRAMCRHQVQWDGRGLPSGIYIARLEASGYSKSIKMVLLK